MPLTQINNELKQKLEQLQKKNDALNRKLQEKEFHFSTVLNNTSDGIIRIDRQLRPVYANQVFYDTTGFTPEQYLGRSNEEIGFPRELCNLFREKNLEVFKNATPLKFEFKYPTAGNGPRMFEAEVSPEFSGEDDVATLITCIRDISELKAKEKALVQAQDQWQHTFDSISDWVSIIDDHCRILKTNESSQGFTRMLPKEVVGKHCHDIITNCLDINPCPLEKALKRSERVSHEVQRPDGKWWLITVDPILKDNAPPFQAVHIVRDITVLKLREKQNVQSKKNAAFRVLAGGIAHDYNNLLAVIMGNLSLAIDLASQDDDRLEFLKEAELSVKMARDLSHKFLAISGYEYSEKNIGKLIEPLKSSVGELPSIENIELIVNIDSGLWPVNFDVAQMRIVFQNLLINSIESMSQGGTLTLNAENYVISEEISNINYFKSPGGGRFVKIEIKDTGSGIAEQVLPKIFDPYFSTKQRGVQKGMGLGLAVVSSILENHGGTISFDSKKEKGTTVTLLIPAYDPKRMVQLGKKYFGEKGKKVKILVMDDEIAMRRLMGNIIQSMGYEVELVEDSQAAITAFRYALQADVPFDLVILDQIISGDICGSDTLKKMKKISDSVKSIVISGSPHSPTITNYKEFGFDAALIKPYTRNEVNELLQQIIE
ncbi:PAS domain S-box-containing protein [Desulfocicer vacuolatum DSM 3385]|uniref:histidine kinase n=1 Tax=Desulfocicer vacuolatum DSM 3385 TaxID=1121400 RepID=A0A1W2BUG3_9BACT|nr:PAS domain-containing sensor histidine kinase [Desulfocicer vacuolatum]SMC76645.1 PAS domain S-box-containing protein [Desulfocicer vacuolatum DSM 3385]